MAILQLLAGKDQSLLVRGNALLVLNLRLDIVDGIRGFHLEGDGLAGEGLDDCGDVRMRRAARVAKVKTYRSAYRHGDGARDEE